MRIPLAAPPGLVSDDTAWAAKGRWADADKVRFWNGKPQVIGGWEVATTTAITGVCRNVMSWADNAGVINIGLGTHSKLFVLQDGTPTDITPSGLAAGNIDGVAGNGWGTGAWSGGNWGAPSSGATYLRTWSLSQWGQTLLALPRGGTIYQWTNTLATVAAAVSGAPARVETMLVTPERVVLALGCTDTAGNFGPMVVRSCAPQALTTWTPSVTNLADEQVLEGGGRLVGGISGAFGSFIWSDFGLFFATWEGTETRAFRIDRIGEGCGLIGPNARTVLGQTAFWLSNTGQFFQCDPGGAPMPIVCPIRDAFFDNITPSQQDKIVCAANSKWGEVWWFYPDARDGSEVSRYLVYSILDGSWSRGTFDRTAMCDAGPAPHPVGVSSSGSVFYHERGTSANGGAINAYVESAFQTLGDGENWSLIRGFWPDLQGQIGAVNLTIKGSAYPQESYGNFGPYLTIPGQGKSDFIASARAFKLRFESNVGPAFWRLGEPAFDVKPTGKK